MSDCSEKIVEDNNECLPPLPVTSDPACKELIRAKCVYWSGDDDDAAGIKHGMKLPEIIYLLLKTIYPPDDGTDDDCPDQYLFDSGDGLKRPYADVGEANLVIDSTCRFMGKTIRIGNTEYWYFMGIEDTDLKPKLDFIRTINNEQPDANGNYNIVIAPQFDGTNDRVVKFSVDSDSGIVSVVDSNIIDNPITGTQLPVHVGVNGAPVPERNLKVYGYIEARDYCSFPQIIPFAPTMNVDMNQGTNIDIQYVTSDCTLNILNARAGTYITIVMSKQMGTPFQVSFNIPPGQINRVINDGKGVIHLSAFTGVWDVICGYFDGVTYFWTYGKRYSEAL